MTSAIEKPRRSRSALRPLVLALAGGSLAACASFVEIPVETPLQSKIDARSSWPWTSSPKLTGQAPNEPTAYAPPAPSMNVS